MLCRPGARSVQLALSCCITAAVLTGCFQSASESKRNLDLTGLDKSFLNLPQEYWTLDEKFLEVSRIVPAFAGLYRTEDGLTIALTEAEQLPLARLAVTTIFGDSFLLPLETVTTGQATYAFGDLFSWMNALSGSLTDRNIIFTDIDEVRNRLVIGLLAGAPSVHIRSLLDDQGIPKEAVLIEDATPFNPSFPSAQNQELSPQAVNDSLVGTVSPRTGGIQIDTPGTWCTLGFNANLVITGGEVRGFVTNSHCTGRTFAKDATTSVFKQPLNGGTIGREYRDNPGAAGSFCPARYDRCRYSDSAFIDYNDSVTSARKVAVTEREASSPNAPLYDIAFFRNVGGYDDPIYYGQAFKTGAKTGFTVGSIVQTCVASSLSTNPNVGLLCQYRADYERDGGDSGAPVSKSSSGRLYGLHWGGNDETGIFSPISGIQRDLGQLRVIAQ